MTQTIEAVYENGVFRPLELVDVVSGQTIRLTIEIPDTATSDDSDQQGDVVKRFKRYQDLAESTGISDLAEHFDDYRFGRRVP